MAKPAQLIKPAPHHCNSLRRSTDYRGPLRLNGVTHIDDVPASCRVQLYGATGEVLGEQRSNAQGQYEFLGLAAGRYRLVVTSDYQSPRRGRVVYVNLEPPFD